MAIDEITATAITSAVRFAIAAFVFRIYLRNRNKFMLYFGLFFLLFGVHGVFRGLSIATGEAFWFFLHRISLLFGTIVILQGLASVGVNWIKKYWIVQILAVISITLAYYDAYILGGISGEIANSISALPAFGIGGIGMFLVAYYFNSLGKKLPELGKNIMVSGFLLQGFLLFGAFWLIQMNLSGLGFYLGLAFTGMIGIGCWMSLSKIEGEAQKKMAKIGKS